MTVAESESVATGGETIKSTTDEQPNDSDKEFERTVSWESVTPERFRSLATGGLLGIIGSATVAVVSWLPTGLSGEWLSVDLVVFVGVILLVGGLFSLLYWKVADDEATEAERRSLRERLIQPPEWSSIRPRWVACGMVVAGGTLWAFGSGTASIYALPMAGFLVSFLLQEWRVTKTVDAERNVIETAQNSYSRSRNLDWAVGVRRVDLPWWSLFVVSNRGKRWYMGQHLLPVPATHASAVETLLRRIVDRTDSPPRIDRDERIIIGGVGASMLAVGPLLYLLSGEGAVLLLIAGPSALVAHFALMHAHRG